MDGRQEIFTKVAKGRKIVNYIKSSLFKCHNRVTILQYFWYETFNGNILYQTTTECLRKVLEKTQFCSEKFR